jgi:hypothetical protein
MGDERLGGWIRPAIFRHVTDGTTGAARTRPFDPSVAAGARPAISAPAAPTRLGRDLTSASGTPIINTPVLDRWTGPPIRRRDPSTCDITRQQRDRPRLDVASLPPVATVATGTTVPARPTALTGQVHSFSGRAGKGANSGHQAGPGGVAIEFSELMFGNYYSLALRLSAGASTISLQ